MMLEAAQIVGIFAAILLLIAVVSWLKLFRSLGAAGLTLPLKVNEDRPVMASRLLLLAFVLSLAAACLACASWISG